MRGRSLDGVVKAEVWLEIEESKMVNLERK